MYIKDFDQWNTQKKAIENTEDEIFYANERSVYWCSLGVNIGWEQDGVSNRHERPVVIVKKFNSKMVWVIPLTSKQKKIKFYYNYTDPNGRKVAAVLAQLRLISTKRLIRKLYVLEEKEFDRIREELRNYLR